MLLLYTGQLPTDLDMIRSVLVSWELSCVRVTIESHHWRVRHCRDWRGRLRGHLEKTLMPGWLCRGIWLPLGRQKMPKEKVGSSWMCMYVIGAGRPLHACMRTESKPPPDATMPSSEWMHLLRHCQLLAGLKASRGTVQISCRLMAVCCQRRECFTSWAEPLQLTWS